MTDDAASTGGQRYAAERLVAQAPPVVGNDKHERRGRGPSKLSRRPTRFSLTSA